MANILKQFDQFGVPFTQSFEKDLTQFKSVTGGIATIIIYLASLMYTVYILVLWSMGEFSPKITTNQSVLELREGPVDFGQVVLEFWRYDQSLLDPFKAQGNILTPLLYTQNIDGNTTESILSDSVEYNSLNAIRIKANLGPTNALNTSTGSMYQESEQYLLFMICDPSFMKIGQYCATDDEIETFFQQSQNFMALTMKFTRLNPNTKEQETWNEAIYFMLDKQLCYTQYITLQQVNYEIKSNGITASSENQTFMEKLVNQGQTVSTQYCKRGYNNLNIVLVIYQQLSNLKKTITYEYPSPGDIFANIGSIVSILLMSKYIFNAINQYFLDTKVLNNLIDFYYPEFKKIIVKQNWRRVITSVTFNNESIDVSNYEQFHSKLKSILFSKLSLTNIVYEISRLGLIIRSLETKENIRKSHALGIRVKLKQLNNSKFNQVQVEGQISNDIIDIDNEQSLSSSLLDDEDCSLLTLESRNYYAQTPFVEVQGKDYYDLNQIIV